jgi:hypothetical protein
MNTDLATMCSTPIEFRPWDSIPQDRRYVETYYAHPGAEGEVRTYVWGETFLGEPTLIPHVGEPGEDLTGAWR